MQKTAIFFCVVLLAACASPPRTANELRQGKSGGMWSSKREAHDINRQFSQVVNDVRRKSMECLRFAYTTTTYNRGLVVSNSMTFYNVNVRTTGGGRAEMIMQQDRKPRVPHDPEGGYYAFVADIERTGAKKTRMTLYGPSFFTWQPIFEAVKGWGEGKSIKCPETP